MSYDLDIALRRLPARSLEEILTSIGVEATFEGAFEAGRNLLITRVGPPERTIDVDGPVALEPEDLDEALAAVVPDAAWLAGIHVPGGMHPSEDRWALELATALAREGEGAVWDPQADRIVWPERATAADVRATASPPASGRPGRPRDLVVLRWHIPTTRLRPDVASVWLDLLRDRLPEAVPIRFGTTEPMQGRLERDGDPAFASAWAQAASRGFGLLSWTVRPPAHTASAFFRPGAGRLVAVVELGVELDRASVSDRAAADRLVEVLTFVATAFDAVYAEAHVEPVERPIVDGRPVVTFRSVRAHGWAGIPPDPSWLAWFGRPYAEVLGPILGDVADHRGSGALLVRTSAMPLASHEGITGFPRLPAALVQGEHEVTSTYLGVTVTGRRLQPADEIPPF